MNEIPKRSAIRWAPAAWIVALAAAAMGATRFWTAVQFQIRNIVMLVLGLVAVLMLVIWWLALSRAPARMRLTVFAIFLCIVAGLAGSFRVRGVTGDFIPIFESRWSREAPLAERASADTAQLDRSGRPDFPQYLGPDRNAILAGWPELARDWEKSPPEVLWRHPIGEAWSGFAVVGNRAVTLEQRGESEVVTCYDVLSGKLLWEHADAANFTSSIGGVGPRATPTIVDGRVYTFGATGVVNCLDLKTGRQIWQHLLSEEAPKGRPEWGYAGAPLVLDGKVIVSAGQSHEKSLFAYNAIDGKLAWRNGSQPGSYSSAAFMTLAGVPQIVMFNMTNISAHDPKTGEVLWEYPWGNRQPQIAQPVAIGADRVLFSSGYGVGAELLEIKKGDGGKLSAQRVWKSLNLKSKMATFILRGDYVYGLDDGILTCMDVRDGSRKWKAGRYGHGQLLLVGELLLVTAENGEIVLLSPTPEEPNELTRFRVFKSKTWNPPALSGDLLLMRTDLEAACVRLPVAPKAERQ